MYSVGRKTGTMQLILYSERSIMQPIFQEG